MFADLSGFTSLSEQLDPETLSEIVGDVITRLSRVVDYHGGTVLNYAGDAILAGFGIPESSGDDAERALAAALDMRSTLAAHLPSLPPVAHGLTLHIGVNSGHAIARYTGASAHVAYTVFGDAVNTAQRLEAAAPSDEIYVGELAAKLGGARFVLEELAPIRVKGKADEVQVWRLLGRRDHGIRARPGTVPRLVGRDTLVARIGALGAASGVAALIGEPGIGKTSIVLEAARRAGSTRWVIGATAPYDMAPYAPWRSVLGSGPESPVALLEVAGHEIESAEAAAARRHAFHRAALQHLAAAAPVVVVLDDVQWLDPASLSLAAELVDEISGATLPGVSLVVTSRPEGEGLVREIVRDDASAIVERLDGLGRDDVAELLVAQLGGSPTARLVTTIETRTGGSPFFAVELLRLLLDDGSIIETATGWDLVDGGVGPTVPPTVEELVQGRLDRLDPASRAIVELASVIGTTVSLAVLKRAFAGQFADSDLGPLLDTGILVPTEHGRTLGFRHGIVRDVAYHRTLRGTRRRLHRHVADALRTGSASERVSLAELAQHLYRAEAGAEAVDALGAAAREAAAVHANESAVALLTQAIECAEGIGLGEAEQALRLRRGSLRLVLGRADDAFADFSAVSSSADADMSGEATLGIARTHRYRGEFDTALSILDAVADDDAQRHALRASVLGGAGRPAEAIDACSTALALGAAGELRVELLIQRSQSYDRLGRAEDAFRDAVDAEALAAAGTSPHQQVSTMRILGALHVDHDRLDEADATLRAAADLAERGGIAFELAASLVSLAFVRQRRGDLEEAIELDRRAVQVLRRIRHGFEGGALANLAHKLCDAGRSDEGGVVAAESLVAAQRSGDAYAEADARYALGRVAAAARRADEARSELTAALAILEDMGTTLMVEDIEVLLREVSADRLARADRGDDGRVQLDAELAEP